MILSTKSCKSSQLFIVTLPKFIEIDHQDCVHDFCKSELLTIFHAVFGINTSIHLSPTVYGCHAATGQPNALKGLETALTADEIQLEALLYADETWLEIFETWFETQLTADEIEFFIELIIEIIQFTAFVTVDVIHDIIDETTFFAALNQFENAPWIWNIEFETLFEAFVIHHVINDNIQFIASLTAAFMIHHAPCMIQTIRFQAELITFFIVSHHNCNTNHTALIHNEIIHFIKDHDAESIVHILSQLFLK